MSVSIPAGRINKLFGTDGGVMLSLYADFPADFDTDTPLLVTIDALEVPLWCERFERRGASGAVAAFADFDTERRAQEATARPLPDNSQAGSRTITTARPTRSSSWKSAAAGCWSPPPRSSSPISTSRGAR